MDVLAGNNNLGGCISGAVGHRYGPRGVYRGSYSLGVTRGSARINPEKEDE
jgi:hypothetical protein